MEKPSFHQRLIHSFFEITIVMKGFSGLFEIAIAAIFLFLKKQTIYHVVISLVHWFGVEEVSDLLGRYFLLHLGNFSLSTQYFIGVYFLFYGLVNLFLVVFLLKGKWWAYPVAITFFMLFIVYQAYRSFVHHSLPLMLFTIFDMVLVVVTWLDYRRLLAENSHRSAADSNI